MGTFARVWGELVHSFTCRLITTSFSRAWPPVAMGTQKGGNWCGWVVGSALFFHSWVASQPVGWHNLRGKG